MRKILKFINKWPFTIIVGLFLLSLLCNNAAILITQLNPLLSIIFLSIGLFLILLEMLVLLLFIFNVEKQENKEESINEKANN